MSTGAVCSQQNISVLPGMRLCQPWLCLLQELLPPSKILTINDSECVDFFFPALQLFLHIQDIKGNVFSLKEVVYMLEFSQNMCRAHLFYLNLSYFARLCLFMGCLFCKSGLMLKAIYRTE